VLAAVVRYAPAAPLMMLPYTRLSACRPRDVSEAPQRRHRDVAATLRRCYRTLQRSAPARVALALGCSRPTGARLSKSHRPTSPLAPEQIGKGEVGVEPGCPGPCRPPCFGCREGKKPTPIVPTSGGTEMGSARQANPSTTNSQFQDSGFDRRFLAV